MSSLFPMPGLAHALIDVPERQLFASRDLAQTRSLVAGVMKPHDLHVHGAAQQLNARMHHMAFGGVSLNRLKYGAEVDIEPGPLDDFYLIQMPLAGHARITSGAQQVASDPDVAVVISPADATVMRWSAQCDQLMVRIDRLLVERAIGALSGRLDPEAVRFQLGFQWRDCAPWRCLVQYLSDCASGPFDIKPARCTAVLPRHVKRVQDFLRENMGEPITADQMALVAGVSLRSLYAGFKDYCGVSPMQYLRALRLDAARQTLLGEPCSNIASVAMRWGFAHLGRFSMEYKERFGERPSQSVRRH